MLHLRCCWCQVLREKVVSQEKQVERHQKAAERAKAEAEKAKAEADKRVKEADTTAGHGLRVRLLGTLGCVRLTSEWH